MVISDGRNIPDIGIYTLSFFLIIFCFYKKNLALLLSYVISMELTIINIIISVLLVVVLSKG